MPQKGRVSEANAVGGAAAASVVRAYARVAAKALASSLMNVDLRFLRFSLSHLPEAVRSTLRLGYTVASPPAPAVAARNTKTHKSHNRSIPGGVVLHDSRLVLFRRP